MKPALLLALTCFLTACTTGVTPAGPDTYMISRSVSAFQTTASAKAAAYREADAWAKSKGLVMVPVNTDMQQPAPGAMGSVELTFRALPAGDRDIIRPTVDKPDHIQRVQIR